ncbi:MAG: MarR family winged helix-turn-helix transcriptional regulator [Thermonemataceae bacterium]
MKIPIEIELGRSCARLFWSLQNRSNAVLKHLGITIEQLRLLILIQNNEGKDQQFLANETLKAKSAITYLLDKMSGEGLVAKVSDERDTRNNKIFLTSKGKLSVVEGQKVLMKEMQDLLKAKDVEEIKSLIETMQTLTKKLL